MQSAIHVPGVLDGRLAGNTQLSGAVRLALSEFSLWTSDSKLPFFQEYTDHGPVHISEVLATASSIVRDECWDFMTAEDAGTLILSVVLHDCAMHLSEEGFNELISGRYPRTANMGFEDRAWPEVWTDFLAQAKRFDGRKLHALWGDTTPVREPPRDPRDMTWRDRALIGEFIRRHHPRIAQEISYSGIPGPSPMRLGLQHVSPDIAEIAGFVARSHGYSIRRMTDLLAREDRQELHGVHIPFIMSLVRISDYIQIHRERAPGQVMQLRKLKSPVSVGEWRKHDAVKNIHCMHQDPEAVFVRAEPADAITYWGLRRLLSDIQQELDESWAVLGEVYGRFAKFGLTVRRIRSNLDDVAEFSKKSHFVPIQARFDAAGADLLKLLVGPLYGNKYTAAVRELLQNAVDAVRERQDFEIQSRLGDEGSVDKYGVVIEFTEAEGEAPATLKISDDGVGMTPEIIRDYYLKAGASYRSSDAWRKQHETSEGHSRVLRGGRFGVGVLAAFMLGERIEVSTRNLRETRGVRFTCAIDDDVVELSYLERPVGTTVTIEIKDAEVASALADPDGWDWYCLGRPPVTRKMNGELLEQRSLVPSRDDEMTKGWFKTQNEKFDAIYWRYDEESPPVVCNGIVVDDGRLLRRGSMVGSFTQSYQEEYKSFHMIGPKVSVLDPDAQLPLSLDRFSLAGEPPFASDLMTDICKHVVAYYYGLTPRDWPSEVDKAFWSESHPAVWDSFDYAHWLHPDGLSFLDEWFVRSAGLRKVRIVPSIEEFVQSLPSFSRSAPVFGCGMQYRGGYFLEWIRAALNVPRKYGFWHLKLLEPHGIRMVVPKVSLNDASERRNVPRRVRSELNEEWSNKYWVCVTRGECPAREWDPAELVGSSERKADVTQTFAEWYMPPQKSRVEYVRSPFSTVWEKLTSAMFVPFDGAVRLKAFKSFVKANKELLDFYASGAMEVEE